MGNQAHCLPLLPCSASLQTRPNGHPYELPRYKYDLSRKSFVLRCLYNCVWFYLFWLYHFICAFHIRLICVQLKRCIVTTAVQLPGKRPKVDLNQVLKMSCQQLHQWQSAAAAHATVTILQFAAIAGVFWSLLNCSSDLLVNMIQTWAIRLPHCDWIIIGNAFEIDRFLISQLQKVV